MASKSTLNGIINLMLNILNTNIYNVYYTRTPNNLVTPMRRGFANYDKNEYAQEQYLAIDL